MRHRKLVTTTEAIKLLEKFRAGGIGRDKVVRAFQAAPVADLGFAQVDTHRALRKGFPEVIFGAGKTPDFTKFTFHSRLPMLREFLSRS